MEILISNTSTSPIYEQIASQIEGAILSGDLTEGSPLPSIRSLANDLHVSVITTKRAYAELEAAGFIVTVQGKGTFVAGGNLELLREERLRAVEAALTHVITDARAANITPEELHEMIDVLMDNS